MTYQPVVPLSGFAGWAFLTRTREAQQEAFNNSGSVKRELDYFAENIGGIQSAEDLVSDRRLLSVALGAFGLDDDINNKYFIQKVLEDGSLESDALANRLSDKRYLEFTKAFGFGDFSVPRTVLSDFAEEISAKFQVKQFETAVGNVNADFRLALALDESLADIATASTTDDGRWFQIMGQPPVRQVFEVALGLPSSFGALDLDLQLAGFRDQLSRRMGDGEIAQFSDPDARQEMVRLFLAQSEVSNSTTVVSGASAALTLLQSAL